MSNPIEPTGCCPPFDPSHWDGKILEWDNKKFIIDKVLTIYFMPLNFGQVMKRMTKKISEAGAVMQDALCLSEHTSKWKMDLYLAVDKEIAGAENLTISGKFIAKVFEGDFRNTGKWCEEFDSYTKGLGLKTAKTYMWYTTCPKCAKVYGKNYVVLVGELG
jgi:hypothetical protein